MLRGLVLASALSLSLGAFSAAVPSLDAGPAAASAQGRSSQAAGGGRAAAGPVAAPPARAPPHGSTLLRRATRLLAWWVAASVLSVPLLMLFLRVLGGMNERVTRRLGQESGTERAPSEHEGRGPASPEERPGQAGIAARSRLR
jgi:hypothetical protein